ncbi:MAG: VOC family protein [Thermomicrobiales bacterium]
MATSTSTGIHHVSAMTQDAQRNIDFYVGVLGLRLVKQSVNFDDPDVYHLWYGDEAGTPGSIITFFVGPWSNRGQQGPDQVAVTSFAIHPTSIGFWISRFLEHGVAFEGPAQRPSADSAVESVLSFRDPDGLMLELVTHPRARERSAWGESPDIPTEYAIHGLHSVTLWVDKEESVNRVLVDKLGFQKRTQHGAVQRLTVGEGLPAQIVNVRNVGGFVRGTEGAGTVHHIAWCVSGDSDLGTVGCRLIDAGFDVSEIIDRQYFHARYARDHGEILHELATMQPGFTVDEPLTHFGERLMIPEEWARIHNAIAERMPPLHPTATQSARTMFAERTETSELSDGNLGFVHLFFPASSDTDVALLLLHGTGGDEESLIEIGKLLAPGAAILSPRGNVLEGTSRRFFRRHAEGVLDQEDLSFRTHELADFLIAAAQHYQFDINKLFIAGFSNGANIAASLLLRRPELVHGAILLSPMLPFEPESPPALEGIPVFIGAGWTDPLVPAESTQRLADILEAAGANVTLHWEAGGHRIASTELAAAAKSMQEQE